MLNTSSGFAGLVSSILKIFDAALPVLVALALALFMIGVVKYIYSEGEHKNREFIMWSLIALFVLVSVWGILRVMLNTLGGGAPTTTSCNTPGCGAGYYYPGASGTSAY